MVRGQRMKGLYAKPGGLNWSPDARDNFKYRSMIVFVGG